MTAEDAAYRALAQFRIPAAERRAFAAEVAAMLADVPRDLLWRGAADDNGSWGVTCELARRGMSTMRSVPSVKLNRVASAAVAAACWALVDGKG